MIEAPAVIHGLYIDLIAPCARDGHFLSREYHMHLRRMARVKDVQGVVVNGPAGEASVLNFDMRMKILKSAVAASPAAFPLLAAIPANARGVERETDAALEAGATGIILLGGRSKKEEPQSLELALQSAGDAPVLAWNISPDVVSKADGVMAVIVDTPLEIASIGTHSVMLSDRSFDLTLIFEGRAHGAVLASANIAEAIWGRVFRYAMSSFPEALSILSERVGPLQRTLIDLVPHNDPQDRTAAAAMKHGLFSMTQNTSAATLPPLLDIGEGAREAVSRALTAGRLMPDMG